MWLVSSVSDNDLSKILDMANRSTTRTVAAKPSNTGAPGELPIRALLFWPGKPDLWFKQLNIHFRANKVTSDQAKFSFALSHIDATNGRNRGPNQQSTREGLLRAITVPQAHEDVSRYSHDVNSDRSSTSLSHRYEFIASECNV